MLTKHNESLLSAEPHALTTVGWASPILLFPDCMGCSLLYMRCAPGFPFAVLLYVMDLTVSQRPIPHPTSIGDALKELSADVELEIGMVL